MQCDKCKKNPAVVHIVKIAGGKQKVLNLCGECAKPYEIQILNGTQNKDIDEMIANILEMNSRFVSEAHEEMQDDIACPRCGQTLSTLRKAGKVGCSHCYGTFHGELENIIQTVQPSDTHIGKMPKHVETQMGYKKEILMMKLQMDQCVEKENYEEAAVLRDKIKALEIEIQTQMQGVGGGEDE